MAGERMYELDGRRPVTVCECARCGELGLTDLNQPSAHSKQ